MTLYCGFLDNLILLGGANLVVDTKAALAAGLKLNFRSRPGLGRNQPLVFQRQGMATNVNFIANKARNPNSKRSS